MRTAGDLIDAFCDQVWLQDGLAASSLASYRRDLVAWSGWLERHPRKGLLAAERGDVEAFLAAQFQTRAKVASINRRLSTLRRFYRLHAAQARDHVVEHDHDAERGVPDHDRPERERDAGDRERRLQRDARDDAGQRDRDDDEERHGVDAEEAVAGHREGRGCAQHERDAGCGAGDLERERERVAHLLVVPGDAEPARREVLDGPRLHVRAVERVEHDHRKRDVQEQHDQQRPDAEQRACGTRFH
jgi:hypothetical protein